MPFKVTTRKWTRWVGSTSTGYAKDSHFATLETDEGEIVCEGEGGTPQAAHAALIKAIKRTHEEHHEAVNAAWRERHVKP
jgi:hypothetical protein